MFRINRLTRRIAVALGLGLAAAGAAQAQTQVATVDAAAVVGTSFPAGFVAPVDDSLQKPVIGFGGEGRVSRTPVIFLHGNNDTPFATACSPSSHIRDMAQFFARYGYSPSELWALGYQGDQCDMIGQTAGTVTGDFGIGADPTIRSSLAHTNAANVPDLRAFVRAVRAYTGAKQVDIVAHGMGVTLAREWVRQDGDGRVRRFVAIEGPNAGMITCSAAPNNPWALPFLGGYTPASPVCQELGSPDTLFLKRLNRSTGAQQIDPGDTLVVRNTDASCLFMLPDGFSCAAPVPPLSVDSLGNPADFSTSARLPRTKELGLSGQLGYDVLGGSAHVGIARSPATWAASLYFLTRR